MTNTKALAKATPNTAMESFLLKTAKVWETPDEIRKLFAPDLKDEEFNFFMEMGKAMMANPFLREIWAVKYGTNPAQIFLGRDFYRRKAQELEAYECHLPESIYSKDQFKVVNGEVSHEYNLADRGELLGAYCLVWKKGVKRPFFNRVSFAEYNKTQSTWKTMPETMIKKVAEAQGLRAAFQGTFAGTYDESEVWESEPVDPVLEYYMRRNRKPAGWMPSRKDGQKVMYNGTLYQWDFAQEEYVPAHYLEQHNAEPQQNDPELPEDPEAGEEGNASMAEMAQAAREPQKEANGAPAATTPGDQVNLW